MSERDLLLGIDFGSGGCKVTLIDTAGHLVGESSAEYRTWYENPGWAEQEPGDWVEAMCAALARVRASGVPEAEPPSIRQPFSLGTSALSSFRDMGMERMYFPGTVLPDSTTDTSASGTSAPPRTMSTVRYSTSAPASMAAPATARIIGDMYGGTPSAAGSSMYPSTTSTLAMPPVSCWVDNTGCPYAYVRARASYSPNHAAQVRYK